MIYTTPINFDQSIACKCDYGNIAKKIWHDWKVLWEDSEHGNSGHASFLLQKEGPSPLYLYYKWFYGSTSTSDHFMVKYKKSRNINQDIENEMRQQSFTLDSKERCLKWLSTYDEYNAPNHIQELREILRWKS